MDECLARVAAKLDDARPISVLDVGSYDVNGTFKPLVASHGWHYTGLDIRQGPNVDIVAADPYCYPIADGAYHVVIAGNMAHGVAEPWRWIHELTRVLRLGGLLAVVVPWNLGINAHPHDYWRYMPDGLAHLFDLTDQLTDYEIYIANDHDLVGSAFKYE
jgi:SAM-dependent methyltransferase